MGVVKFTNRATSLLASSINTSDTLLSVTASTGSRYPTLTAGDWFPVVVVAADGSYEIMRATARSGDVITVTRAQEGTTAISFTAGARVDMRLTNAALAALISDAKVVSDAYTTAAVAAEVTARNAAIASNTTTTLASAATAATTADNTVKTTLRAELNAPIGTLCLFVQTTAPTGWTKNTSYNDRALRVTSSSISAGGSVGFSTVFAKTNTDNHTLSEAELPAHAHYINLNSGGQSQSHTHDQQGNGGFAVWTGGGSFTGQTGLLTATTQTGNASQDHTHTTTGYSNNAGSGTGHSHPMDIRVLYIDVIIAQKN